jgi:hypothetical protein
MMMMMMMLVNLGVVVAGAKPLEGGGSFCYLCACPHCHCHSSSSSSHLCRHCSHQGKRRAAELSSRFVHWFQFSLTLTPIWLLPNRAINLQSCKLRIMVRCASWMLIALLMQILKLFSFSCAGGTAGCDCYTESDHLPSDPFCYSEHFPHVLGGCNIVSLQRGGGSGYKLVLRIHIPPHETHRVGHSVPFPQPLLGHSFHHGMHRHNTCWRCRRLLLGARRNCCKIYNYTQSLCYQFGSKV